MFHRNPLKKTDSAIKRMKSLYILQDGFRSTVLSDNDDVIAAMYCSEEFVCVDPQVSD